MEPSTPPLADRAVEQAVAPRRPPEQRARVLVGVDGSAGARAALLWAMRQAVARQAPLDVLTAVPVDFYWTDAYAINMSRVDDVRAETTALAQRLLDEVQQELASSDCPGAADLDTRVLVPSGSPAGELVSRSGTADLLVVGTRGRSAFSSLLLGSVALHCVVHAHCPVAVIPLSDGSALQHPRVVVGIDGSPGARTALVTAAEEAVRAGVPLDVVVAFETTDWWSGEFVGPPSDALRDQAQSRADEVVEQVLADRDAAGRERPARVTVRVLGGHPDDVLVEQATGASMLVLGSAGTGVVRGLVLGSVALHCVLHAPCPTVVVHEAGPASDPAPAVRSGDLPEVVTAP